MPPLRAPILTKMVVSASMASVLMRCCSSHNRSRDGLLIRTICMRRMHHMRGGAGDVTGGLLTAALTASTHHANRPWQRSLAVLAMRWQPELLLVSGCSGHADRNRPAVAMRTLVLQAPAMRWQLELRLVSGCSGHADQNRPSARSQLAPVST